ncbi:MAG: tRNA lysidine(34) synthetase TilS [Planctomycetota bacterium]|nr:MAG: tRNA lysidine(34) synthetase TilS [Planctomycetota bacterium]
MRGENSSSVTAPDQDVLAAAIAGIHGLGPWPEGACVALACSGGADSTFLALAWRRFAGERGLSSTVLVVDHAHRPGTAAEARAAQSIYRELGFECALLQLEPGLRGESSLRDARYRVLAAAAQARGAAVLLTAHQADDQAETLLLRLARGTGLRGLAGIPARRQLHAGIEIRRPLLALRREAIRSALRAFGQAWIEDPSNVEPEAAARNRVRAELLPALAQVATGDPVDALLRLAAEAQDWSDALAALLASAPDWRALPSYLRRQALAELLRAARETVSSSRLRDLEAALLRHGRAGVTADLSIRLAGGRLRWRGTLQ